MGRQGIVKNQKNESHVFKIFWLNVFLIFLTGCSGNDDGIDTSNKTYVPDDVFESVLIEKGLDDKMDNYVLTENIESEESFFWQFGEDIKDLTGIEDFKNLKTLTLYGGSITKVNLSKNINLVAITFLSDLNSIDFSNNEKLTYISLYGNNLSEIDLSNLKALKELDVRNNKLSSLDISDNLNITELRVDGNLLDCIKVNEEQISSIPEDWIKDEETKYLTDCQ